MDFETAFHRANRLRELGDLAGLKALFEAGDDAVKAGVLNGLWGEPSDKAETGSGIVALAVAGAGHRSPEVRRMACYVFQNQSAWGVDVAAAVEPLLTLLGDPDAEVRRMAAFATGNLCKRRFDWSGHFQALRLLLRDEALYVPEAAAWALAKFSQAKHDIAPAVPDLVRVLAGGGEYDEPRKAAARALLHHAKKSPRGRDEVRRAVARRRLDRGRREIGRFLDRLDVL